MLWLADSTSFDATWSYTDASTNATVTGNLDLGALAFTVASDPETATAPTAALTVYSSSTYSATSGDSTIGTSGTAWFTLALDTTASSTDGTTSSSWVFDVTLDTDGMIGGADLADLYDTSVAIYLYYYDDGWGAALTSTDLETTWSDLGTSYGEVTLALTNTMVGNVTVGSGSTDLTDWDVLDACASGTASVSRKETVLAAAFALSFF